MAEDLLESAEDLSRIAFGFMASKAIFSALHVEIFTYLSEQPLTVTELSEKTGVPANRITILMTALTGIGIVGFENGRYQNAPAAEHFLVRGAKYDFGDYLRYQIDRQMYPFLQQLNGALDGTLDTAAVDSYKSWMADETQAQLYSESQHSGSLGPGRTLARMVDLSKATSLLDVGGGTGAMTISLCDAYPQLESTIIDFPNVSEIGWRFISEAGLVNRVRYIPSDALECDWPSEQGAVLMSYLFSGVPGEAVPNLIANAFAALEPGGIVMVHDFMVEDDRKGPPVAALWQLQHMAFTPDARSIAKGWLTDQLAAEGFVDVCSEEMIPGMTCLVHARKPS